LVLNTHLSHSTVSITQTNMSLKSKTLYYLPFVFMLFLFCTKVVRAEDDDEDDILGEILVDIMVGAAIAVCQSNAVCNGLLTLVTVIFITISLIGWCLSSCECDCEAPSRRQMRRAGTIGVGYGLTSYYLD